MLSDGQGSVRAVMPSGTGTVPIETRQYALYGTRSQLLGSPQTDYGYTGEPLDEDGLIYLRARYYSPALGVFTSLDPFEGIAGRPMSLNGYSWVEGNTPNLIDPTGLQGYGSPLALPDEGGGVAIGPISPQTWQQVLGGQLQTALERILSAYQTALQYSNYPMARDAGRLLLEEFTYGDVQVYQNPGLALGTLTCSIDYSNYASLFAGADALRESELYALRGQRQDTGCQPDDHRIEWPMRIWQFTLHGDIGEITGIQQPPQRISRRTGYRRNPAVTASYRTANQPVYDSMVASGDAPEIHHKWPLFLGGPDREENLVFLTHNEHVQWHDELYRQGKFGYMSRDPDGTAYCITRYR